MILLVLGMHRSGTSAVARTLNLMGAALPGTMMEPAPGENPLGFWESREIMEIHDRFLAAVGSRWDDMRPLPEDAFQGAAARSCRDELSVLLEPALAGAPLLAVKDPRICRLLPVWRRLLEDLGEEGRAVLPVRNPIEVVHSLLARNGIERERGLMLWLTHSLAAEGGSRGMRRETVFYADFLDAPSEAAERLADALGCFDKRRVLEALPEIESFWRRDLRHHAREDAALFNDRETPGWIRDLYSALLQRPLPLDELDRLSREVARAIEGVGRYLAPAPPDRTGELSAEVTRLAADRDDLARRQGEAANTLSRAQDLYRRVEAEAAALQERLQEALAAIAAQAASLRAKDEEAGRLGARLIELEALLARSEAILARRDEEIERVAALMESLRRGFGEKEEAWDREAIRLAGELSRASGLLLETEAALARGTADIEAKDAKLRQQEERISEAAGLAEARGRQLAEREVALARLSGQIEAKEEEIRRAVEAVNKLTGQALLQERQLAERDAALSSATVDAAEREAALARLSDERDELERQAVRSAEDIVALSADLAARGQALAEREAEMTRLDQQLTAEQREVALLRQERERTCASIRELEQSLERQRTHLAVLAFRPGGRHG